MRVPIEPSLPLELTTIREMTAAMLVAAQKKRWTEVQRIDDARLKLLRAVPAELVATYHDAVCELLQEALSATRAIEEHVSAAREGHGSELKRVNQRQHAAKSYDSHAAAV